VKMRKSFTEKSLNSENTRIKRPLIVIGVPKQET